MSQIRGCVTARWGSSQYPQFDNLTESPVAQWLEHPTRSRRVVGSNPIWGSGFSESTFLLEYHVVVVVVFVIYIINDGQELLLILLIFALIIILYLQN